MSIPEREVEAFLDSVRDSHNLVSGQQLIRGYRELGLCLIEDPTCVEITNSVIAALSRKQPYSVVRIGDGEANLLTYMAYPGTPVLDTLVAQKIISAQGDTFHASKEWLLCLQQLMLHSIQQADIVGVRGFWWGPSADNRSVSRPIIFDRQKWRNKLISNPRGTAGVFRAAHYLLKLARSGCLDGKIIASAHLYFGILANLKELLGAAEKVILITNRVEVAQAIRQHLQGSEFQLIRIGRSEQHAKTRQARKPRFLNKVSNRLPKELQGVLCLIGAGPWSEIYCSLVKQRGGVGIDLGSGFDLLGGLATRPIHRHLGLDLTKQFSLMSID